MYCNRCGKEIESGNICDACAAAAYRASMAESNAKANEDSTEKINFSYINQESIDMPEPENRMYGFGKALVSTILSSVGFIFAYIALLFSAVVPETGLAMSFLALPLIIIPFIFGIKSINLFKSRKATCAKPIATLILGIVGLSTAAMTAFFNFIAFIIATSFM